MTTLDNLRRQLREQHNQLQLQADKLKEAIAALDGSSSFKKGGNGVRRILSPSARRRIAAAQRARWAKIRGSKAASRKSNSPSRASSVRVISPAARRKIAAAQRARWAKIKGEQQKKAA
jgi:hypothetical protein